MKKIFTKNALIAVLLLISCSSVTVIAMNWSKLRAPAQRAVVAAPAAKNVKPAAPKGSVRGAIQERAGELQNCYNSYLQTSPAKKEGFLKIEWRVDAGGRVTAIEAGENQFSDSTLMECILTQARSWTLQLPAEGHPVIYAHKFSFHDRTPANMDFSNTASSDSER